MDALPVNSFDLHAVPGSSGTKHLTSKPKLLGKLNQGLLFKAVPPQM